MFKLNEQALEMVSGGIRIEVRYVPEDSDAKILNITFDSPEELSSFLKYLQPLLGDIGVERWSEADVNVSFRGTCYFTLQKRLENWFFKRTPEFHVVDKGAYGKESVFRHYRNPAYFL